MHRQDLESQWGSPGSILGNPDTQTRLEPWEMCPRLLTPGVYRPGQGQVQLDRLFLSHRPGISHSALWTVSIDISPEATEPRFQRANSKANVSGLLVSPQPLLAYASQPLVLLSPEPEIPSSPSHTQIPPSSVPAPVPPPPRSLL